jgi:transcriptional antiterminator RfaH
MPLLPPQTSLWPDDLLDRLPGETSENNRWWVLHTRPRGEKSLAHKCLDRGLAFFLPLHERRWRTRGRQFTSHLPLFPGYLFLCGDSEVRLRALETNLVVRCLLVADQLRLCDDLARVHRLIASGAPLTPEASLRPGSPVEVTGGPFVGMRGKILRRGKKLTFLVEVQFLNQGVSVEVDSWMIQPLAAGRCRATSACGTPSVVAEVTNNGP